MNKGQPTSIGSMRWMVSLCTRGEKPIGTYNVQEDVTEIVEVHCQIKPVSLQTFLGGEQVDFGITHRVIFRWQPFDNLGMFNIILRKIVNPDGTTRNEIYQIHRVEEFQGLHRYIIADVELQKYQTR